MKDYYERMKGYYERRAAEYDDAYLSRGVYSDRRRNPEELEALQRAVSDLPPCRVLDVGCGTGFITQHLRGEVVGLDQSEAMLEIARERVHDAAFVRGDALDLPFGDLSLDRVFCANLYGLLHDPERRTLVREARRVASELVVLETAATLVGRSEAWEQRPLLDGSRHWIYRRYFTAGDLAQELGGGRVSNSPASGSSWSRTRECFLFLFGSFWETSLRRRGLARQDRRERVKRWICFCLFLWDLSAGWRRKAS